jgi:hypothetical protein
MLMQRSEKLVLGNGQEPDRAVVIRLQQPVKTLLKIAASPFCG